MTQLTSLAKARAVERGRAQPTKTVRHVHLSDRPLLLVMVELAGEACAPLAAMVGDERDKPHLLTVYEPRDRTQRFEFAGRLADVILPHIAGCVEPREPADAAEDQENAKLIPFADAPQLIVANLATAGFLRLLGRSTRFRRTVGEYAVPEGVPLLGRWLTYYSERTEVPTSCLLLSLTSVLADHWATGQSATEDANLGALLAWLDPPPDMTGAEAARQAEDPAFCPPAGPATDPEFDAKVLEPAIKAIRSARLSGDAAAATRARSDMDDALRDQLEPTWDLMWRGIDLLRALPEGEHVPRRWERDRRSFTAQAGWISEGGIQAKRDGAVAAAIRLARLEREQQSLAVERAYDDPLVMAEYRLTGEAFAGTVTWADPARQDSAGKRATLRPWITVATSDEVLVEQGDVLRSPARPAQEAKVIAITPPADGLTHITLELKGGMGRKLVAEPGSVPEVGERITLTTLSDAYQPVPAFPKREETPWTHGGPPPEYVPTEEDAQEDWS